MKNSSELIAKNVYSVNAYYTKKQNKTKELFFRCLKEKRSNDYFKTELHKIWGNIDHAFMDKQIDKLMGMVHDINVDQALNLGRLKKEFEKTENWVIDKEYFKLTPEEYFQKFEKKFEQNVARVYTRSSKTIKDLDSTTYLQEQLAIYDKTINQRVTYFKEEEVIENGKKVIKHVKARQVQLSSYLSMVHNTNLTRAGWNQTMFDSERIGNEYFIIPFHPFSCPDCYSYQNRPLSKYEVENIIGVEAKEQEGDLLHPNCKCTLAIYWDSSQIRPQTQTTEEVEELSRLRQKVNGLTLEKSRLLTDKRIAQNIGNEAAADKAKNRINAINKTIRDIKSNLPSESLKKQITAIKR